MGDEKRTTRRVGARSRGDEAASRVTTGELLRHDAMQRTEVMTAAGWAWMGPESPMADCCVSIRVGNRLVGLTVGDLVQRTAADLRSIRGFGLKSLQEVELVPWGFGLRLADGEERHGE